MPAEFLRFGLLGRSPHWLPLQEPQLLLVVQEFESFGLIAFRLVRPLHRVRQLAVDELISQAQSDIRNLLHWIRYWARLSRGFGNEALHFGCGTFLEERGQAGPRLVGVRRQALGDDLPHQ